MTLSTHAVVGAGLAVVAKANPIVAFVLGFVSHFLMDAIPHWDYLPRSKKRLAKHYLLTGEEQAQDAFSENPKEKFIDFLCIGLDFFIGLALVFWFFLHGQITFPGIFFSPIFWGVVGGVLPDFLQLVYIKFPKGPMPYLQRFHADFMHAKIRLNRHMIIGPAIQIVIIAFVIYFVTIQ
jgi:hypothetical protein